MKRYLMYLKYVIRHKWFVFVAGMKLFPSFRMFYRCIVHDMSKFSPLEFISYAKTFYTPMGNSQYDETIEFSQAWNHHQKCNKHHWQYWILKYDRGDSEAMPMPQIYIEEMFADWVGAGKAINGSWNNVNVWYAKADIGKFLHPTTRNTVETMLKNFNCWGAK